MKSLRSITFIYLLIKSFSMHSSLFLFYLFGPHKRERPSKERRQNKKKKVIIIIHPSFAFKEMEDIVEPLKSFISLAIEVKNGFEPAGEALRALGELAPSLQTLQPLTDDDDRRSHLS